MASEHSFDIVSKVDDQEVVNGINQAMREVTTRYDLKDSKSEIEFKEKDHTIALEAPDEFKLKAVYEILIQKLVKREISPKAISAGKIELGSGGCARQTLTLQQGVPVEKSKEIIKDIKDGKFKVQVQIQGDQVRITSKNIDDLQAVMKFIRGKDYPYHLSFTNFR